MSSTSGGTTGVDDSGIELTAAAADAARDALAEEGFDGDVGLRLVAEKKACGCGNLAYTLRPARGAAEDDHVSEQHGVSLVVDSTSMDLAAGSVVDYADSARKSGFVVENPEDHCGCGGH